MSEWPETLLWCGTGTCAAGDECRTCALHELEALRAQVQRVRDITIPIPDDVYDLDSYTKGASDALDRVWKTLDGGGDE